jgi:hypothetical protein
MSQIEITPALLSDLRQKAEAATPGEWLIGYGGMAGDDYAVIITRFWKNEICELNPRSYRRENAEFITACNPAVMLALVAEVAKLKVDLLETQIQRAEGVLRMFRGEQQDFTGLFSEAELIAEGLDKPAEIDGTTAGIWASFIERKQLECEQYRSLVK